MHANIVTSGWRHWMTQIRIDHDVTHISLKCWVLKHHILSYFMNSVSFESYRPRLTFSTNTFTTMGFVLAISYHCAEMVGQLEPMHRTQVLRWLWLIDIKSCFSSEIISILLYITLSYLSYDFIHLKSRQQLSCHSLGIHNTAKIRELW